MEFPFLRSAYPDPAVREVMTKHLDKQRERLERLAADYSHTIETISQGKKTYNIVRKSDKRVVISTVHVVDSDYLDYLQAGGQPYSEWLRENTLPEGTVAVPEMSMTELRALSNSLTQSEFQFVEQLAKKLLREPVDIDLTRTKIEKSAANEFGITDIAVVKELTELALVVCAKQIVSKYSLIPAFDRIVKLYDRQPNISLRTSESVMLQQYSTPVPLGFLAGVWCQINASYRDLETSVFSYFEPSAGNGMLTVADDVSRDPRNTHGHYDTLAVVNEIDPRRNRNLRALGFAEVLQKDATKPFTGLEKMFDAVLTNPPFGRAEQDYDFDGYTIKSLEQLMALRALACMKDSGRAAIIIGGHTTWDNQGRIQAGKNRIFFNYLYSHYNVADVINIDGKKLYSRQGTSVDVRLILIDGRKAKADGFAPLRNHVIATTESTFRGVFDRVTDAGRPQPGPHPLPETGKALELARARARAAAAALELEIELLETESTQTV